VSTLNVVTALPRGARFYRADLHVHSFGGSHDVKDASMTPQQIVQRAIDEGLDVVAIADHNEISNVQAAIDAAAGRLLLVPAVELSTSQGHLLCYLPNLDALMRFHAQLDLADRGTPDSRCRTAILQCLSLLDQLHGFAVLAHVDAQGGFEEAEPGFSAHKADVLSHRALVGIEVKNASSSISYAPGDADGDWDSVHANTSHAS
jgi:PHP domain-containing protein